MDDFEARRKFDYVVTQYKQLNVNIEGRPIGLHGKVVNYGTKVEYHLVFHYVDNTLSDVIQTCTFVVSQAPDTCEGIGTYCTGYLKRPPRPLLELKSLSVCKNDLHFAEEDSETTTELGAETEAVPKELPNVEASTKADPSNEPNANPTPLPKFRMFN